MSRLSQKEVEQIARLARLKLTEQEKKKFVEQLSLILDYVEQLNQVETKEIEPIGNINGLSNVSREDQVQPSLAPQELLQNAPAQEKGYLKVKGVKEIWG